MNNIPSQLNFIQKFYKDNSISQLERSEGVYTFTHNHADGSWEPKKIQSCIDAINRISENYTNDQSLLNSLKKIVDSHNKILIILHKHDLQKKIKAQALLPQKSEPIKREPITRSILPPHSPNRFGEELKKEKQENDDSSIPPPLVSPPTSQRGPQQEYFWRLCESVESFEIRMRQSSMTLVDVRNRLEESRLLERVLLTETMNGTLKITIITPFWILIGDPEGKHYGEDVECVNEIKAELQRLCGPSNFSNQLAAQQTDTPYSADRIFPQATGPYSYPQPSYGTPPVQQQPSAPAYSTAPYHEIQSSSPYNYSPAPYASPYPPAPAYPTAPNYQTQPASHHLNPYAYSSDAAPVQTYPDYSRQPASAYETSFTPSYKATHRITPQQSREEERFAPTTTTTTQTNTHSEPEGKKIKGEPQSDLKKIKKEEG